MKTNQTQVPHTKMISLKDNKADLVHPPQFHKSEIDAFRSIKMALKDPNSFIGQFPSDFSLIHVGDFHEDGTIVQHNNVLIRDLSSLVEETA